MLQGRNIVEGWRSLLVHGLLALLFLILIGRYYYLMIVLHEKYAEKATANHIRAVPVLASRGVIYDRAGNLIVDNAPSYTISVIPIEVKKKPESLERLSSVMEISVEEINRRIVKNRRGSFAPAKVFSRVPFEKISHLQEHRLELIGVTYSIEPIRNYVSELDLSHALGYTREINRDDLNRFNKDSDYQPGDQVGWKGLEKFHESVLHGQRGFRYVEVNALGQEIGEVQDRAPINPIPGHDLVLSIDSYIQHTVEKALADSSGSVVILNHKTGEILAYASRPGYNLEMLSGRISSKDWEALIQDPRKPLYDRGIQGLYPAGSTLKPLAALYSLENHSNAKERTYVCRGSYRLGNRSFGCWKKVGHGKMNLHDAIQQSCNVYFFNLIQDIGIEDWAHIARDFGFGQRANIDIPGENKGLVPDTKYMNRKYGQNKWTRGNLLNIVVGQGDVLVTPLQLAQFAGMLAQRGTQFQPHFVNKVVSKNGDVIQVNISQPNDRVTASKDSWDFVHQSMWDVVNGKKGTAKAARQKDWDIYGKTGTAQNPHGEDHAWFIGFSLDERYPYSWAVLLENGGGGGGKAAPLIGKVLRNIAKRPS
ncbi:MAG: penicillin-binding protein 2 [Candidatus Marinimicrobia bacterium]|jgi:penicillin-binding protein 2|nr:penicillin-binding protein 2 [Candidatus Neomarinimicrobiota bacterium]MBT4362306.1 penicillin-binding protein 2 [Candidatus Neomarinimicrobiota bacterium]MBT4715749.1 penicillin-binding protein 2 [Candidatus Neomarinimicrobiota bacterium]MBT4947674.1 penicillin-binding protein 2 [Candidatus Neomarinimicrobiota bacterium]MBT5268735.1 penicillin-binding protein 2 [Candidatus Neomarinimicrobiota bacterium]